jgi:hypothetical protein
MASHPAWDDLDAFLQDDEFAIVATVILQGGASLSVTGIFDEPYLNADLGEYSNDTTEPRLTCKMSAVPGVTRGDTAIVDGVTYDVMSEPQRDGTGMAVLRLAPRG